MRVQRVLMAGSEVESWALLGEDHVPVEPVERFLAFLSAIERSPNTVLEIAQRQVTVMLRVNDNRARAKAGRSRVIPAGAELMRLYADYLNREYGSLDSDYVFVNLWGGPLGHPLGYPAVYDLVGRLRRHTDVAFGPHHFRHTYATWLQVSGVALGASFGKMHGLHLPATSPFGLDQGRSVEASSHAS